MRKLPGRQLVYITLIMSALIVLTYLFYAVFHEVISRKKVYINEVCTSNLRAYKDENDERPDYIEIYNGEEEEVDLKGWKLSDSADTKKAWTFPDITIPGKGFLIVEADGTKAEIYTDEQPFSVRKYVMTGEGYEPTDTGLHASFKLSSKGTELFLSDPHDKPVDSVEVPEIKYDTVFGRIKDGGREFDRMLPTPGETNEGAERVVFPTLSEPVLSAESGFYEDKFTLTILSPDGGEIRYTTDGSIPDKDSKLYEGPINIGDASLNDNVYSDIVNTSVYLYDYYGKKKDFHTPEYKVDKCNVIRAAVFRKNGEVSDTVTASYFVGFKDKKMYEGRKVISLVADPDDLFGSEKGIYVLGDIGQEELSERYEKSDEAKKLIKEDPSLPLDGSVKIGDVGFTRGTDGNYMQHGMDWEREALLTYFSNDHGSVIMQQNVGIRIKGNSSRHYPMKGLNIYARKAYSGKDRFETPFFSGVTKEEKISLSAGGNDYFTLCKDAFISERIRDTGLDIAAARFGEPVYLFLNGEFWGVYIISERPDENFFSFEYGVDKDNVIFIKEGEVEAGESDDIHYYYVFLSLYEDKDFSDDKEYREFCDAVDIDSLLDYYALRVYTEYGMDWPHLNYGFWRTRNKEDSPYGDCKWRFVNFDNNVALNYNEVRADMMDVLFNGSKFFGKDELFVSLWENSGFRKAFLERLEKVKNEVFMSDEALQSFRDISDSRRIPVSESYKRWRRSDSGYDISFFDDETGKTERFLQERGRYIDDTVKKYSEGD